MHGVLFIWLIIIKVIKINYFLAGIISKNDYIYLLTLFED